MVLASIYQAAWNDIREAILNLASGFSQGAIQLERINRAFIVLIQKPGKENTVDGYRPISLQNCSVKILSKVLAFRLQIALTKMIHMDQTGFLKGRCIFENLIFATELIQACHKRGCQTLIIKLDFAKAFDSVNWESLLKILAVRGFPDNWIGWINKLLTSSKSLVLINGIPGSWINCRRGLRQGDPLSPYLFILVADVLQRLLERNASLRHPIYHDRPYATIQYADDTLIIYRAEEDDVRALKSSILSFSKATGLHINFAKSTMISLHVDLLKEATLSELLQCKRENWPMSYLGLPLTVHKLSTGDLSLF